MPKKKTIEEVRQLFESKNCQLLSDHYINSKLPLEYICCNGHQTKISFSMLQKGVGCPYCSGKKKKTTEEVESAFTKRGYTLLNSVYKNIKTPLEYVCNRGHKGKICLSNLQMGVGCLECSGNKKKTIEEVRGLFTTRGYTLLSKNYSSNKSTLNYICSNGHNATISFADLRSGYGCPTCANHGFSPSKPAILYYLRFQFEGNFYYKIGITNRSISERFQSERTAYIVIKETIYALGKAARDKEKAILKKFSAYRYKGKPFLDCGNTELFIKDILYIDSSVLVTC